MPANRSRTERWRMLLEQIAMRGGGIEFSVARPGHADTASTDVMWRVRLMRVGDDELIVEQPAAVGRGMSLDAGLPIVAVMTVGQNRWMFHSRTLGPGGPVVGGRQIGLRLAAPEKVDRCSRRDFLRIPTASLRLPRVECYPLLEPSSVIAAETANRHRILDRKPGTPDDLLPEVGPAFSAKLMNIGGGGVGLLVTRDEAAAASHAKLLWLRIDLTPDIPAPIAITAKQAHAHIDSEQNLYLGLAFEFAFNPDHREFVVDQISRYVQRLTDSGRVAA